MRGVYALKEFEKTGHKDEFADKSKGITSDLDERKDGALEMGVNTHDLTQNAPWHWLPGGSQAKTVQNWKPGEHCTWRLLKHDYCPVSKLLSGISSAPGPLIE
eukprot:scaffold35563_cov13-Tisochrysis_lutea.AAC.1